MRIRHHIRAFQRISLLVVVSLLVTRSHVTVLGGIGRFVALLILASLLLFVVSRSADICKAVAVRYRFGHIFLFAVVLDEEPVWQTLADDFNPAEPVLPSRFQLPPPQFAA